MKKLYIALLISLAIFSCKKNAQITPAPTPVTDGKPLLLASEITLAPNGKDTLLAYFYSYDDLNRMVSFIRHDNIFSRRNDTTSYRYDQPSNVLSFTTNSRPKLTDNTTIAYINGVPQTLNEVSTYMDGPFNKVTYYDVYDVAMLNGKVVYLSNEMYPFLAADTITYEGDNLKTEVNFIRYTYGKNKGPLYSSGFKLYLGGLYVPLGKQNEILHVDSISNGGVSVFKYNYNGSGYPINGTQYDGAGNITGKLIYNYIPLK